MWLTRLFTSLSKSSVERSFFGHLSPHYFLSTLLSKMQWRPPLLIRLIWCFLARTVLTPIGTWRRGAASILLNVLVNYNIHPRPRLPLCFSLPDTAWVVQRESATGVDEWKRWIGDRWARRQKKTRFHIKSIDLSKLEVELRVQAVCLCI